MKSKRSMANQKIKISIFLPSLTAGGAERIMSFIAQKLDRSIFSVTLVVTGSENEVKYDLTGVDVVFLNKDRVLFSIPKIIGYLRRSKPDICFSAIRHLNIVMGAVAFFFPKIKFVAREVNVMSVLKDYPEEKTRKYPAFISKMSFTQLDAIICQSNDMLNDIQSEHPNSKEKLFVINNPITDGFLPKEERTINTPPYKFITVGSLEPRKGHQRILKGLAKLDMDFEYTMVGSGSQKKHLDGLIDQLGLGGKVRHVPFTKTVGNYLKESHIFIQGSYVEGFPNALLESCAVGTPIIAFRAPGGINEIVEEGINGYTVDNVEDLVKAIHKILELDLDPKEVSQSVYKKYDSKIILDKYQDFFVELMR
ncbi:glycosyltransferase [Flagellimonas alvinocaridis]|uniref:Glycosyltransferase n=1 Tax=Flagellimonas alvinocaridis TaxID=2530200 RepID=A0A4S8RI86_9FLAO|nr:glycosyltransferase [Allomuricauda alvinocaridis]THV58107.1 glycosyltransferase [Allomuricauda alvinocaridis]